MAQTKTLRSSEIVEAMVEHVRTNLRLEDMKEKSRKSRMTFTGAGVLDSEKGISFSLEVITTVEYSGRALRKDSLKMLAESRGKPRLRKDRTYTGILFPKSVDYSKAAARFECPYFRQADLLSAIEEHPGLMAMYGRFSHNDVKHLSRIEWEVALPMLGQKISYYNPLKKIIQVHEFRKFPCDEIIPDNISLEKGYFWDFAGERHYPVQDPLHPSKKIAVFLGIQEGLHDCVRKIIRSENIRGMFTLKSYKEGGAKLVPTGEQMEMF